MLHYKSKENGHVKLSKKEELKAGRIGQSLLLAFNLLNIGSNRGQHFSPILCLHDSVEDIIGEINL